MVENAAFVKYELSVNPCCTECLQWRKQYLKMQEKYSKLELRRNALREGIDIVNENFDLIENENKMLKQAMEGLKMQANKEKDEREKESMVRAYLENEVSSLRAGLLLLQENHNSVGQEADGSVLQLQERLATVYSEINRLKELLDKERVRADSEKKKSDEASKKINAEKNNVTKTKKLADIERKKADDSRFQCQKLKTEIDEAKSWLALEMSKNEEANKRVETEKRNVIQERIRADLAVAEAEEQRKLAEINFKRAMDERNRVKQLCQKMGLLYEELKKKLLEREHAIMRGKRRAESERKEAEKQRKIAEAHKMEEFVCTEMVEDVELVKEVLSVNPCCTEWRMQYLKMQEKYLKLELRRNALREGINMVNEKFDLIENENKILKQALEGLKMQANKE